MILFYLFSIFIITQRFITQTHMNYFHLPRLSGFSSACPPTIFFFFLSPLICLSEWVRSADLLRASGQWWTQTVALLHQSNQRPIQPEGKHHPVCVCCNTVIFSHANNRMLVCVHILIYRLCCQMLLGLKVKWGRSVGFFSLVRPEFTWTQLRDWETTWSWR